MIEEIYKILNTISLYGLEKLGLYLSKYRGFVVSRDDPKGYSRLQLQVPDVYGDSTFTYWAWPSSNYSGIGYGSQVLPQSGDMVWVEFERGNPKKPIWSFGHFGKGDKPENLKNPNNYWFKTPGGHTIELDDSAKAITITSSLGHIISLDDAGISIDTVDNSPILIGGTNPVLFANVPNATKIEGLDEIGIGTKLLVG